MHGLRLGCSGRFCGVRARTAAEVGRQAHPTRPESPDAADLGSCEPVRPLRIRYDCPAAARIIQMAAQSTTVRSTPSHGPLTTATLFSALVALIGAGAVHEKPT